MSENKKREDFIRYKNAVEHLKACFNLKHVLLLEGETKTEFSYFDDSVEINWLAEKFETLAKACISADFTITLSIEIFYETVDLNGFVFLDQVFFDSVDERKIEIAEEIPKKSVGAVESLLKVFSSEIEKITASELFTLLETIQTNGTSLSLSLHLLLEKQSINTTIEALYNKHKCTRIYCFLFPETVLSKLRDTTLQTLEDEYFSQDFRTIFIIFGCSGFLKGDGFSIFGTDPASVNDLWKTLGDVIPDGFKQRAKNSIEFREAQNLWLRPTKCIFPETFSLKSTFDQNNLELNEVHICLQAYRVLLSIIYLADYVEVNPDDQKEDDPEEQNQEEIWTVEFRGMGSTRLVYKYSDLFKYKNNWNNIYQLFCYSYDRFSTDKLEITQQFMSIIVEHLNTLFEKASEIKDATQKVYDKNLIHEVKDYFVARQTIQEKLRMAVKETSDSVIDLTRDVSSDVYKILGAVLAGVVSYIIKPEIGLWAILAASLTYAAYFGLAAFYHLPTIIKTNTMRVLQHTKGVKSYQDILRNIEIQEVVDDINLKDASELFEERVNLAGIFYKVALVASLLVAALSIFLLATGTGSPP